MYPRLGGIENVEGFDLYYPFLALATAVNVGVLLWLLRREGFAARQFMIYIGLLGLGGFLGAKVYSFVFHGGLRGLETELAGGWRYPGAVVGVIAAGFIARRLLPTGLSFGRFFDAWVPGFCFAIAIGRIGCLFWGCCHGAVCSLPWALRYPRGSYAWFAHYERGEISAAAISSLPVHPLPLYLFGMEFALAFFLLWFRRRKAYDGQVLLVFLAVHGLLKFLIEYFRDPYHVLHQLVLPLGVVATVILFVRWKRDHGGSKTVPAFSSGG